MTRKQFATLFAFPFVVLAAVAPASALDMRFSPTPGNTPGSLKDDTLGINRADGKLFWKRPDGSPGVGTLLNPTDAGRTCVEAGDCSGLNVKVPGGVARSLAERAADVFHVVNYGAKCDGVTDDAAAITAAFAAGAASSAYQNNRAIRFSWPAGATQTGCVIASGLNLTIFNKGSGANPGPRVELGQSSLLCRGEGIACIDATNARYISMHDITLRGDAAFTPKIGIQVGVNDGTSAAWHDFSRVNLAGYYSFSSFYNFGSEAITCTACYFTNAHSASGPIITLGSVSGGFGGADGVYPNVALTGGAGKGALANITVVGGAVASVVPTFEGFNYKSGDILTAASSEIGGTSGFSVPVSLAMPYSGVIDGSNHWRASSPSYSRGRWIWGGERSIKH